MELFRVKDKWLEANSTVTVLDRRGQDTNIIRRVEDTISEEDRAQRFGLTFDALRRSAEVESRIIVIVWIE